MPLPVTIRADLRFDPSLVPAEALGALSMALRVTDPMDPTTPAIVLARKDSNGMAVVPRGFAHHLVKGLGAFGIDIQWIDQRVSVPMQDVIAPQPGYALRSYQETPCAQMLRVEQGIYEAPTGSGKTITTAFFLAAARQRALIIVDKMNLVTQWQDRIREATGYVCGTIGDGQWAERDITITTRQSLWARHDQLDEQGWWSRWGAVIFDEAHGVSAETVRELLQRFPAKYRIGLSATPDREEWLTIASRSIIGEIFHRTTEDELEAAGVLVRPKVVAVRTPFEFPWKSRLDPRIQWTQLIKALRSDPARNHAIGKKMGTLRGHAVLVDTDQVGHAHELRAYALSYGWPDDRVFLFTGQQKTAERVEIMKLADEGDIMIISTIGKEALDIPRLDRFLITWPTKQDTRTKQMIGRVRRMHDEKSAPEIVDFWDHKVSILNNQFTKRRGTYARAKMELEVVEG